LRWFALDLETWLIAPGYLAPRPVSICFRAVDETTHGPVLYLHSDPQLERELQVVLGEGVVGHNVAFDLGVIAQWYPRLRPLVWRAYAEGRVRDTKLACQLLDVAAGKPLGKYALDDCCSRWLGVQVTGKHGPDVWRLRYRELTDVPISRWPKEAYAYAIEDVRLTAELWCKVRAASQDVNFDSTLAFQTRAAWALHLSSAWGLRTDPAAVAALKARLEVDVDACTAALREHGILRRDGTRDQGLVAKLVEDDYKGRGQSAPKTPTGKAKTDTDALGPCTHPALVALRESSKARTMLGTFVPVLEKGSREPLNPTYTVIRESGRTSCSNPNIQNLPRDGGARECFVARPGYVYACADFHVAELVCLAQVCLRLFSRSNMAEALRSGMDLHLTTASRILGESYEQTVALYKAGDKRAKEARQLAKAMNFGTPGGMAAPKLREYLEGYGIHLSEGEVKSLRDGWLALYPEMGDYFRHLKGLARAREFTIVHPLTGFVRGGCEYTSGANHYFQHLCAQVAKEALFDVSVECYTQRESALYGSRIVAFVHDEIILEAPEATAPEAADRLATVMQQSARKWIPDLDLHAEGHIMRRWYKSAGPVRGEHGRLVPWEPKV
jgi:hypothetical protein